VTAWLYAVEDLTWCLAAVDRRLNFSYTFVLHFRSCHPAHGVLVPPSHTVPPRPASAAARTPTPRRRRVRPTRRVPRHHPLTSARDCAKTDGVAGLAAPTLVGRIETLGSSTSSTV
jgi:hypothetical protein